LGHSVYTIVMLPALAKYYTSAANSATRRSMKLHRCQSQEATQQHSVACSLGVMRADVSPAYLMET